MGNYSYGYAAAFQCIKCPGNKSENNNNKSTKSKEVIMSATEKNKQIVQALYDEIINPFSCYYVYKFYGFAL